MKKIEKELEFANGMLNGVAQLCNDCDFVPYYGVELIEINGDISEKDVYSYFEKRGTNLTFIEMDENLNLDSEIKKVKFFFDKLLKKWVIDRVFKSFFLPLKNGYKYFDTYRNEFIEILIDDLGVKKAWHVSLDGNYEHDAEGILIQGDLNFLVYFGFSD